MNKTKKTKSGAIIPATNSELIRKLKHTIRKQDTQLFQLKNLIDALPGDVYWKDVQGIWRGMNKRCAQSLQRMGFIKQGDESEVLGKTDYQLFDKKTADGYRKNDLEVIEKKIEVTREEITQLPSGEQIILLSTKRPFLDKKGNIIGIIGNTIDISYLKQIEMALKRAKEAAEAASHAKTEFIANMSHDIRTPLSGVVGMSEILLENITSLEQKQYAQWIHESGAQLLKLLNSILDIVSADNLHEQDIHIETFDLRQCIEDLIHLEKPSAQLKKLEFIAHLDTAIPQYLKSDRNKLHRILLNLLGNAIKFTDNGSITIVVKLISLEKDQALIHFAVTDTGIGIPKDQQDKVFDRFHRINPSYKGIYTGHGVGLHIAQAYVHLLGSEIQLTSELGVGTTFSFDLLMSLGVDKDMIQLSPAFAATPSAEQEQTDASDPKSTQPIDAYIPRLLLVEDNHIALKMLENYVAKYHCHFLSVSNAEQALQLAQSQEFDLIITDIGLPGMSGDELARQIRNINIECNKKNPIPIIGLTAHADEDIKASCRKAGMNDVFSKPINLNQMNAILDTYFPSKSTISTEITESTTGSYGKLGLDLPDTEEELFMLDDFPLLDIDSAIKSMGSKDIMRDILKLMISEEIQHDIHSLEKAHERKDWETVEKLAHKMKGGAIYIGTVKMKYACQYLERYHKAGHHKLLEPLYQQLINVVYDTQKYIGEWIE